MKLSELELLVYAHAVTQLRAKNVKFIFSQRVATNSGMGDNLTSGCD